MNPFNAVIRGSFNFTLKPGVPLSLLLLDMKKLLHCSEHEPSVKNSLSIFQSIQKLRYNNDKLGKNFQAESVKKKDIQIPT